MGEKDALEKVLLEHNDVFADVVNGTVFNGREVVKEDELVDTTSVTHFKNDAGDTHEQIRDIAKFWKKDKVIFSFIGIENQTVVDRDMILRVISYDGATYKNQIGKKEVYPVVTIVIYWGSAKWNAPTTLRDRLIKNELTERVPDYKFDLIDIGRLSNKDIEKYKGDFSFITNILTGELDYNNGEKELKHPDEVLDLLAEVTKDTRFTDMKDELKNKKEGGNVKMLKVMNKVILREFEKGREEGRSEGWNEGRNEGWNEGRSEGEKLGEKRGLERGKSSVASSMKKKGFKLEDIIELTGLSREKVMML